MLLKFEIVNFRNMGFLYFEVGFVAIGKVVVLDSLVYLSDFEGASPTSQEFGGASCRDNIAKHLETVSNVISLRPFAALDA